MRAARPEERTSDSQPLLRIPECISARHRNAAQKNSLKKRRGRRLRRRPHVFEKPGFACFFKNFGVATLYR
jgi:hypothetical protein